jgi:hypothetical protein
LQELAATRKPVPDDQNGAVALMDIWQEEDPVFWKAFRAGQRPLPDQRFAAVDPNLPGLGSRGSDRLPWNAVQIAVSRAFVETNRLRSARVRAALARSQAQFPIKFSDGTLMLLPHLVRFKNEAARLPIALLLDIMIRQPDAALDQLEELVRMGDALRDEPATLSQLVRIACLSVAISDPEKLLANTTPTGRQLDRIESLLESVRLKGAFYLALLDERATALSVFDKPARELRWSGSETKLESTVEHFVIGEDTLSNSRINVTGLFTLDRRLMLETFNQLITLNRGGKWGDIVNSSVVVRKALSRAQHFPPKLITLMVFPPRDQPPEKIGSVEARRRGALLALEAVRLWLAHQGRLPETLDEIVAAKPGLPALDPFGGERLRYRILPDGFVISSVGPDWRDPGNPKSILRNISEAGFHSFTMTGGRFQRPAAP